MREFFSLNEGISWVKLLLKRLKSEIKAIKLKETNEILARTKEWDIVFQTSNSRQSKAIEKATDSNITHMWILVKHNWKMMVLEASSTVKFTDFEEWKSRWRWWDIYVKRLWWISDEKIQKVLNEAKKYTWKRYDTLFQMDSNQIYCSELIYKAFKDWAWIEIWNTQKIWDLNFSSIDVQTLFIKRLGLKLSTENQSLISLLLLRYKTPIEAVKHLGEIWLKSWVIWPKAMKFINENIITPKSMFEDSKLETVY